MFLYCNVGVTVDCSTAVVADDRCIGGVAVGRSLLLLLSRRPPAHGAVTLRRDPITLKALFKKTFNLLLQIILYLIIIWRVLFLSSQSYALKTLPEHHQQNKMMLQFKLGSPSPSHSGLYLCLQLVLRSFNLSHFQYLANTAL